MPAIRLRFNYNKYVLSDRGIEQKTRLIGYEVSVGGRFVPFGGFLPISHRSELSKFELCEVENVEAFYLDSEGMGESFELPRGSIVVGFWQDKKVILPVLNNEIIRKAISEIVGI